MRSLQKKQTARLQKSLKEYGVDWREGTSQAGVKLVPELVGVAQGEAGDKLSVKLKVKNVGDVEAFQVYGNSESRTPLFADREFLFGALAPGDSKEWVVEIPLPKDVDSRRDTMRIQFYHGQQQAVGQIDVPLIILGLEHPRLSFSHYIDDAENGNGDGRLQVGEQVDLVVVLENTGLGLAPEPMVMLRNEGGRELFIEKGRAQLEKMERQQMRTARLSFKVRGGATQTKMKLQVFDGIMGDYWTDQLRYRSPTERMKKSEDIWYLCLQAA